MRIFKTKLFARWARKEGLPDKALKTAVDELNSGAYEASLGGNLYKKRIAASGSGKSGGFRTLIACRIGDNAFFVYGYAKNQRANISQKEEKALKALAKIYLSGETDIDLAVRNKGLIEVK